MPYERYTMGQMIPRMRDALVRGIFEYGMSGPAQTVQKHLRWGSPVRRKAGQDAQGAVHRWHDRQGDNGGADLREAQVRQAICMRIQRTQSVEPAGLDHVLVRPAGQIGQGVSPGRCVRLRSPFDPGPGSCTPRVPCRHGYPKHAKRGGVEGASRQGRGRPDRIMIIAIGCRNEPPGCNFRKNGKRAAARHAAGNIWGLPDQRVQVPQGYGQDTIVKSKSSFQVQHIKPKTM